MRRGSSTGGGQQLIRFYGGPPPFSILQASRGEERRLTPGRRSLGGLEERRVWLVIFRQERVRGVGVRMR